MIILMIAPQYRPMIGGYEIAAERLSCALCWEGHEVTVVTERRNRAWPRCERHDGVPVRRLPCVYRRRLHLPTSLLSLAGFLLTRGRRYNLWHVHAYGYHAGVAVGLGLLLNRPVVVKLTSSGSGGIAASVGTLRLSRLMRWLHQQATVVALSREQRDEALHFGIASSRIRMISNGVDPRRLYPRTDCERARFRQELGLGGVRRMAIAVGRLAAEKDLLTLLRAWHLVRMRLGADWVLVILGDGPERNTLQRFIEAQGLGPGVLMVGTRLDVERWLGAADLYLTSSLIEGLGNALLEAMASGLATVTTRVAGTMELVERPGAGIRVPCRHPEALAKAVIDLATDVPARTRMGLVARRIAEAELSIEAIAERYLDLYRELLAERPATAP